MARPRMGGKGGVAVALIVLASAADALAGQAFTADAVEVQPGKPAETGRVYHADQGMRFEFERQGHPVVQIFLPAQGLMRVLFPGEKTYLEFQGPTAGSRPADAKPETPCPPPQVARCERIGSDAVNGIATETWRVTPLAVPAQADARPVAPPGPTIVWWDKARKMTLRDRGADGASSETRLTGRKQYEGRSVEVWETTFVASGGQPQRTVRWHDPELDIDVHAEHPNGAVRDLRNVVVTKADPAWFALPSDYRRLETPPKAAPSGGPSGNYPQVQQ
ncbi:MAG: hypothetical protein HQL33_12650 [Alphaproteobacteria bacterium]|nr:hypothetical protein [Alphaproteobacteria bacterium]